MMKLCKRVFKKGYVVSKHIPEYVVSKHIPGDFDIPFPLSPGRFLTQIVMSKLCNPRALKTNTMVTTL